mmetsp:Transcript_36256/g.78227  ORF Transcript_36256/g.78227 Transcript_36256/m.78227 type:complete len:111 (+) Transcript_36256:69-401(+)
MHRQWQVPRYHATAIFHCKVYIYLVPLIGLGSDQVQKSSCSEHGIEAYHIDEHKREDAKMLISCLKGIDEEELKKDNYAISWTKHNDQQNVAPSSSAHIQTWIDLLFSYG